jgi:choline dehydrogenase-like flavoprotein
MMPLPLEKASATMSYDFDVIVIGSGAGGATFAAACARAGKHVLVLERGNKYEVAAEGRDEQAMLIDKKPYHDQPVRVNGMATRLYAGGVLGGSTALYGAALMRPSADDFHPGKHYGNRIPRAIWDWPIAYDALEPHYSEAERLYGVAGCSNDPFGPLQKPRHGYSHEPLPIKPINRKLVEANVAGGLQPFRLPLAIDFGRCLQCDACAGYICPNGARRSSAQLVESASAAGSRLQVMTNVEADRFCKNGRSGVSGVEAHERSTERPLFFRARRYALAAGAIGSPLLLLRSGIDGPWIGRNYMLHLSPIVAGIFAQCTGAERTFVKQVGFADYYFGTKEFAHKLGIVQSLPVPGPLMTAKAAGKRLPRALVQCLRKRMLPLAGIVEDLPNPANQVCLGHDGAAELHHGYAAYDVERGQRLTQLMRQILKRAGALFCLGKPFASDEHVAHQCGTLRFGTRAADAVTDSDCRMFDQPNVFIVDGSIFPTSLGVGPALTIIANALRVAGVVVKEV